jgi:hypothetical protein
VNGVYGYRIDSALPLRRLRGGTMPRGRIAIELATEDPLSQPAEIIQLIEGERAPEFAVAHGDRALFCWCAHSGGYRLEPRAAVIHAEALGDPDVVEDRLLGALIPLFMIERGELVLHAAAALTPSGAVAICGPSGRGKSTLVAALDGCGFPALTEDVVALDGASLWPGPAGVRLVDPAAAALGLEPQDDRRAGAKRLHLADAQAPHGHPVPLAAIVRLEPRSGSRLHVRSLAGPEALAAVFPNVLRLGPETAPAAFSRAADLVRAVPCFSACLPDDLRLLGAVAGELVDCVASSGAGLRAA